jgi:hypothetical protein
VNGRFIRKEGKTDLIEIFKTRFLNKTSSTKIVKKE